VANGNYRIARRHGDLVFTSGMTPRSNGVLIQTGPITTTVPIGNYQDAAELAASNALAAARTVLVDGEQIGGVLSMTVFIAAGADFTEHSRIADFASGYLVSAMGETGSGTRAAVGVASLPGGAAVEIQLTAVVS
jgi:enamine deaminase RidA (YjgF/YER057c/UK114 family)